MTHMQFRAILATALVLGLSACASKQSSGTAEVEIKGTDPAAGATVAETPTVVVDAQGIATYEGYQAAIARDGDTVASVAARVGLSASELGAYNGLSASHQLRGGDELVLPPRPGGYGSPVSAGTTGSVVYESDSGESSIQQSALDGGTPATGATAGASEGTDGWSPDLAAAAIERSTGLAEDGSLQAPPSSAEPVPEPPKPVEELQSPDLKQYQTPGGGQASAPAETETSVAVVSEPTAAPAPTPEPQPTPETTQEPAAAPAPLEGVTLALPVQGPIAIGFNKGAGPNRNDGVDFAVPAGTSVHAAEDGRVALVSQALGGLGTIVLVRHSNDLLTVYGRLGQVFVSKGDYVERGQQIGSVARPQDGSEARMHFEVRRGAESVDPEQFF